MAAIQSMRVAFVSTYPPQFCGIGTYTAALARGFLGDGDEAPTVLSEAGARTDSGPILSVPSFRRREDYVSSVVAAAVASHADIVHVQHAPDIFGMDERLPRLFDALRAKRVATVVTLHTVHSPLSGAIERRFGIGRFHRRVAEAADAVVVHGVPAMAAELVRQGAPRSKVRVIAHGTPEALPIERREARRRLGISLDGALLLYFGFIHPQKNVHTILLAMARLRKELTNFTLVVSGSLQNPSAVNRLYLKALRTLVRYHGLADAVVFREQFASTEDSQLLYRAADLVLLPYAQGYGSASGVAHQAMGAGSLPLCSRSPKFTEIGDAIDPGLLVATHSPAAWARAIGSMLSDEERRAALTLRVQRVAEHTAWPRVAAQHRELYRALA